METKFFHVRRSTMYFAGWVELIFYEPTDTNGNGLRARGPKTGDRRGGYPAYDNAPASF